MSRQQKRIEREAKIIATTMRLLEDRSFLDLRMSDVSQSAECSMGAVYSHFSCKEDLLIACAYSVTKDKTAMLFKVIQSDLIPLDQLLAVALIVWVSDNQKPQHYQLRQLAMNPSVWQRASPHRSQAMNALGLEIQAAMVSVAEQALLQNGHTSVTQQLSGQLVHGLIGLTIGLFQMKESGFGIYTQDVTGDEGVHLLFDNIERYLNSWNLHYPSLRQRLEELNTEVRKLISQ